MSHKYPVEVLQAALEKGVSEGLLKRPSGELELNKVLSSLDSLLDRAVAVDRELAERKEQERLQPVKVADAADIPWPGDDVMKNKADVSVARIEDEKYSISRLITLVVLVLGGVFLFWGSPDVWDKLHERAMSELSIDSPAACDAANPPR